MPIITFVCVCLLAVFFGYGFACLMDYLTDKWINRK